MGIQINGTNDTISAADGSLTVNGATMTIPAGSVGSPSISPTGDSNTGIFFPSADTIAFAEGGVEAARFNSSGNLVFPSGQGIDFSANSNAAGMTSEILDDYERGTWTPSFVETTTENNMYVDNGLTIYHADYTKIGTNVWISLYIKNDDNFSYDTGRSGSSQISIGGLPFTTSNTPTNSGYYPAFVGWFQSWTSWSASYTPMGYFNAGLNSIVLTYAVANGTNNVTANFLYSANSAIILSGWYQTDS